MKTTSLEIRIPHSAVENQANPQSAISLPQLLRTCRFDRSHDHGEDLVCFILQIDQQFLFHQPGFNNQLHPIHAFVALFLNNPHFGNKFSGGTSTTSSPIIGSNRCSAPEQLFAYYVSRLAFRKCLGQPDHSQSKNFCSVFEIFTFHGGKIDREHRIYDFGIKQIKE